MGKDAAKVVHGQGFSKCPEVLVEVDENGIWGTWHIGAGWSGGFHVWPKPGAEAERAANVASEPLSATMVTVLV